jgi:hypothetical protein
MKHSERKFTYRDMWRIARILPPEMLADPQLYFARRNLLKAYRRLCGPTNLNDLGYARAHARDAIDLLETILGLEEP